MKLESLKKEFRIIIIESLKKAFKMILESLKK